MPYRRDILGSYALATASGAITTIAAGTNSAGHLFTFRWADATKKARIRALSYQFLLTTAFGAAQEVAIDAFFSRSYSANSAGGTAVAVTTDQLKKRVENPTTSLITNSVRIAAAAELTSGSQTLAALPFLNGSVWCAAVGATFSVYQEWAVDDAPELSTNEGICIRNQVLMGAAGIGKLLVSAEWDEFNAT